MTGAAWAQFVIPPVAFVVVAVMLVVVYYADAHPYWTGQGQAPQQPGTAVPESPGQRPEVPRQATSPEAGAGAAEVAGSAAAPASGVPPAGRRTTGQ